jgi:tetratricopeptide (TPR) repeat protein
MPDRIAQLKELLESEPDDVFCLYSLAQEYGKAGDLEDAIVYYDRTIETDPNYCYAYYHKARALEEMDEVERAVATLRTGLERARAAGDVKAESELAGYLDILL